MRIRSRRTVQEAQGDAKVSTAKPDEAKRFDAFAYRLVVVDDADDVPVRRLVLVACGFGVVKSIDSVAGSGGASGRVKRKVTPQPALRSTEIAPPWASTMALEIARPMPMPCAFIVWNATNTLSSSS
jgi:hypothetical protein